MNNILIRNIAAYTAPHFMLCTKKNNKFMVSKQNTITYLEISFITDETNNFKA